MAQNMTLKLTLTLLACMGCALTFAQNTVGTITYAPEATLDGYTLVYPHNQPHAYLLNFCGEVVNMWESETMSRPGNTAYLLPNGDLMMTRRPASISGNPIWAGGGGAVVERRSWDNEILWSYVQNNDSARFHHDIAPMPNGNVLAICWEAIDSAACALAGRDPEMLTAGGLWSEKIVELQPNGTGGAEVVWEWRLWDHLVQNVNPEAQNFGEVSANPHRIDLNYPQVGNVPMDFVHMNSIDYNPINDHILVSAPEYDEIWVIDHGNFSDGSIKWRWGNPMAYGSSDSTQHHLHYQHDANWVDEPYQTSSPFFGKISVFNNRVPDSTGTHSALTVVVPPYDEYDNSYIMNGAVFAPSAPDFFWEATEPSGFSSTGLSSFQPLAGPNFLVCEGRAGRISEITLSGDTVWQYVTPLQAGQPVAQGTELAPAANLTFKATRYPAQYPAFNNPLDSLGTVIELNGSPLSACLPCDLSVEIIPSESGMPTAQITGGTAPFEVLWTDVATSETCTELDPCDCNPEVFCSPTIWFVTLVVTDANGCTSSDESTSMGLTDGKGSFRVWPNPTSGTLNLSGIPAGNTAQLFDLHGRLVATQAIGGNEKIQWQLPELATGTYLLKAEHQIVRIHLQHP